MWKTKERTKKLKRKAEKWIRKQVPIKLSKRKKKKRRSANELSKQLERTRKKWDKKRGVFPFLLNQKKKFLRLAREIYFIILCRRWHKMAPKFRKYFQFIPERNIILSLFVFFCVKIQQYNRFTCRWPNEDETVNRISIWILHRIFEFSFLFVCHSLLLQMENGKIECSVKVLICMKMENCHKTINHFGFDVVTFRWQTSCPWTTLKTFNRRNVHSPKAYCSSSFFCGIFFLFSIW